MLKNRPTRILLSFIGFLLLAVAVYNLPFVNSRLAWRLDNLRAEVLAILRPPSEQVFYPGCSSFPNSTENIAISRHHSDRPRYLHSCPNLTYSDRHYHAHSPARPCGLEG